MSWISLSCFSSVNDPPKSSPHTEETSNRHRQELHGRNNLKDSAKDVSFRFEASEGEPRIYSNKCLICKSKLNRTLLDLLTAHVFTVIQALPARSIKI